MQRNGKQSFSKNDQAGAEEMARQLIALNCPWRVLVPNTSMVAQNHPTLQEDLMPFSEL